MKQSILLDGPKFQITIKRLCQQLIENHGDFSNAALVGIQPRGTYLAKRLSKELEIMLGHPVPTGILDITFFRDDFRREGSNPLLANSTEIDFIVEGKNVIFIDDVLWTGRTIRSAMDAIQAFGRAKRIELLVLVDRRFSRQIPIEPDYIGIQVDSIDSQKVAVNWEEVDGMDSITLLTEKK
ncbi:bifunctional pyr operon transcriptional regulator/uracil phosphoribosyltransferase PyrR [Sphingobacterium spiritivorum]|uniref:Phosphoribosyl transferase domain protein n=1 Tax=Sphingobacterium spiritivorum ATCC 33861 TaxID=525373 RepID=D7VJ83_SPHSI|nr:MULTISPECIES: bifunctional pyr operon transcriptional regulator/uracil phosphoribosyltransferase PyrR [Sphingobacterium]EFK58936.1 phosphoribosyl transferase domain protein [Sphingobacterium spiritivorum ATCC 33861]QQT27050.1 bifunctional pyr operon transcriptional regulator/uracil phosphoribosyltransferase PyrR [Sphingobacterium spiritivorum]QQT36798.1 bifunctional pyr operon transcriptional regulator/uracil phosphoribosyltransferase PyrR [Sphingobacterium spiritivorum]WQD33554.1 bifunction